MAVAAGAMPSEAGFRTLAELATDVRVAREAVHDRRRVFPMTAQDRTGLRSAHASLLAALEVLASELTVRRLPVPHRLRDELRLQRELCRTPARAPRPRR